MQILLQSNAENSFYFFQVASLCSHQLSSEIKSRPFKVNFSKDLLWWISFFCRPTTLAALIHVRVFQPGAPPHELCQQSTPSPPTTMRRTRQIDVHRALALAGLFSFLLSCARACLLPFLTLYFRQLGLPPAMVGVVIGSKHLINVVWSPASGLLFKLYNKRRVAISCALALSAALPLLLLLLPALNSDPSRHTAICNLSDASGAPPPDAGRGVLPATSVGPAATSGTTARSAFVSQSDVTASAKAFQPNASPTAAPASEARLPTRSKPSQENTSESKSATPPGRIRRSPTESAEPRGGQMDKEEEPDQFFLRSLKAMDAQHQLLFLVLITVSLWEVCSGNTTAHVVSHVLQC